MVQAILDDVPEVFEQLVLQSLLRSDVEDDGKEYTDHVNSSCSNDGIEAEACRPVVHTVVVSVDAKIWKL
jgi:hypothetical protein